MNRSNGGLEDVPPQIAFLPTGVLISKGDWPDFEVLSRFEISELMTATTSVLVSWNRALIDRYTGRLDALLTYRYRQLAKARSARQAYSAQTRRRGVARKTVRRLVHQSRTMLAGAVITHRREDFDVAESAAQQALEHVDDEAQRCHVLAHLCELLLARAESEPDMMNWEVCRAAARRSAAASFALAKPRHSDGQFRDPGRGLLVRSLRVDSAAMMATFQTKPTRENLQEIRSRAELAEFYFSEGPGVALWPRSKIRFVRRNEHEQLVMLHNALVQLELNAEDARFSGNSSTASELAERYQIILEGFAQLSSPLGFADTCVALVNRLMDMLPGQYEAEDKTTFGETANLLIRIICTGLISSIPGTRGHLRLLDLAAQATLLLPTHSTDWLARVVWEAVCATPVGDALTLMNSATHWAEAAYNLRDREMAAKAYRIALRARQTLIDRQALPGHKETWLTEGSDIHGCAAHALALADCTEEAVLALEQGRAVLYSSVAPQSPEELTELSVSGHRHLADSFLSADTHYRNLADEIERSRRENDGWSTTDEDIEAQTVQLRAAADKRDRVVASIRQVDGFGSFPEFGTGVEDIRCAARESPIAYLAPGLSEGSLLLVRPTGEITHRSLPLLTVAGLKRHALDYLHAYRSRFSEHGGEPSPWQIWGKALYDVTEWLWPAVMGPLLEELDGGQHVRIAPAGLLAVLPMWAAWKWRDGKRTWAIERVACSYVPNSKALLRSQQKPVPRPDTISALIIDGPEPSTGYERLEHGGNELEQLRLLCSKRTELSGYEAALETVLEHLPSHSIVHFNAHGYADENRPRKSGIVLARDTVLTAGILQGTDCADVALMVLSSCESGLPGGRALDEMISMPGAVYSSAGCSVISSLWNTEQAVTADLFRRFYRHLKEGLDSRRVALALREAQLEVLNTSAHPALWAPFYLMG